MFKKVNNYIFVNFVGLMLVDLKILLVNGSNTV